MVFQFISKNFGSDEVIAALVVGVLGIVTAWIARGGSNRRVDRKRRKLRAKLKQTCLHVQYNSSVGTEQVYSLCNSLGNNPWTTCTLCKKRFPPDKERLMIEEWAKKRPEDRKRVLGEAFEKAIALRERLDEMDDE